MPKEKVSGYRRKDTGKWVDSYSRSKPSRSQNKSVPHASTAPSPKRYEDLRNIRFDKGSPWVIKEPWPDQVIVVREEVNPKGKNYFRAVKIPRHNLNRDDFTIISTNHQIGRGVDLRVDSSKTLRQILRENNPDMSIKVKKTISKEGVMMGKHRKHKFHVLEVK